MPLIQEGHSQKGEPPTRPCDLAYHVYTYWNLISSYIMPSWWRGEEEEGSEEEKISMTSVNEDYSLFSHW